MHTSDEAEAFLVGLAFAMPRVLALFALVPLFSREALPGLLRAGVAVSIGVLVAPALVEGGETAMQADVLVLLAIALKEAVVGMMLGFAVAVPFWALEGVGYLIDTQRGASIASVLDPVTGNDTSPLGVLLGQAMIVFFFASGAYLQLLGLIYESFRIWSVFDWWPRMAAHAPTTFLGLLDHVMRLTVLLSAPLVIAMLLVEIGMAIVGRSASQLDVFFLAMPVKSAVAILMLALYAAVLFDYVGKELAGLDDTLSRMGDAFALKRPTLLQ